MLAPFQHRLVACLGAGILVLLLVGIFLLKPLMDSWVEGPGFHAMLDKQISKGLKLQGEFGPIHRVGWFGISADRFIGTNGNRTIAAIHAKNASGMFNPLGIGLRRWEIDSLRIESGTVTLQKTEPIPGAPKGAPWPPWWALFWPYRVHLQDVMVDEANILWQLRGKESGIYHTRLEITPNGRDFEYDAHGGELRTPLTPALQVVHSHMLIRKPRLYCSEFILTDNPSHPEQQIRLTGNAGLQDDRSMKLQVVATSLRLAPWMPLKLQSQIDGSMSGHFTYNSTGTGLETGKGDGAITLANTVLRNLPMVHQYSVVTGSPDPGEMKLKTCHMDLGWDAGALTAKNIEIECEGVFRVTGTLTIAADKSLSGQILLGLTDPYLKWLPTAKTAIFIRQEGAYHFAAVHFSGTAQKPVQDLTPRVVAEIGKSPLVAMKLFFNQAGEWFDFN